MGALAARVEGRPEQPLRQQYWCPCCHRAIRVPPFVRQANISGTVNIRCGSCKRGIVRLTFEKREPDPTEQFVEAVLNE